MITDVPTWVGQIELGGTAMLEELSSRSISEYSRARILVRLHRRPIGFLDLAVPPGGLSSASVASAALTEFAEPIRAHLTAHGDPLPDPSLSELGELQTACGRDRSPVVPVPISVIVCTHERAGLLGRCLRSLRQLQYGPFEVVIVDNAPVGDETWREFQEVVGADSRFHYVREPVKGLSSARNRGIESARLPFLAFTDDDVIVDPDWLNALARGFTRESSVVCVTGLVVSPSLDSEAERYFDRRGRGTWSDRLNPCIYDAGSRRTPYFPFDAASLGAGANFACAREAVAALGGFDEALGAGTPVGGGEDLDIFVRLIRAGGTLVYEPSAVVWHFHRVSADDLRVQLRAYGVGFGGYVFKQLHDPVFRRVFIEQLPRRMFEVVNRWRSYNRFSPIGPSLVRAEVCGWITGPLAYRRSRDAVRRRH